MRCSGFGTNRWVVFGYKSAERLVAEKRTDDLLRYIVSLRGRRRRMILRGTGPLIAYRNAFTPNGR